MLTGTRASQRRPLPEAKGGVLVLDQVDIAQIPIRPLDAYRGTSLHYLDVSGIRANSIAEFGGDDVTVGGIVKLYAGRCQLVSLCGLERFTSLRYLYLEENNLRPLEWTDSEGRVHGLFDEATGWQLLNIDLQGNPVSEGSGADCLLCGLSCLEWLNGTRWTEARRQAGALLAEEKARRQAAALLAEEEARRQAGALLAEEETAQRVHAADAMRNGLQEGLIQRRYRHVGLRAAASTVHGTGCFATSSFSAGEFVCDYFGQLVPRSADSPSRGCAQGIFRLNDLYHIEPESCDVPAAHAIALRINHGCTPNLMSIVTNLRRNLLFTTAEAELLRLPLHPGLAASLAASLAAEPTATLRAREAHTPALDSIHTTLHHSIKRPRAAEPGEEVDAEQTGRSEEHDALHAVDGGAVENASRDVCGDVYDVVCLIALRDIRAGEELTYGYGRALPSAICRCGAVSCLGSY
eukprot:4991355-Prymnesium_polylepis.1